MATVAASIGEATPSPSLSLPAKSGSKAFGVYVLALVWLTVTWVIFDVVANSDQAGMLLAILTTLLLPLAILHVRGELDIFEPIVFANSSLASMFIGRPIFDISTDTWLHTWFGTFFDARPGFDAMLFYAWLGIFGLQLGYLSPFGRSFAKRLPKFDRGIDPDRMLLVAGVMYGIGALLFEEYVRQSGGAAFLAAYLTSRNLGNFSYKAASGYLYIGPLFWPPAGMVALASWLKFRRRSQLYLAIVCLASFFVAMLGGVGRTFELQGILGVVVILYVARNKRPSMLLVLPVVVVGLLYFVYGREARTVRTFEQKQLIIEKIAANPAKEIKTIWSEDDAAMCDYLSVMIANIPSRVPFGNGSTVTDLFLRAYPRFLWPGNQKPDEHIVYLFKRFFPRIYYRYTTGAACSVIGELYSDHGGPVVFLGMFFFGVLFAAPKAWMQQTRNALPAQLLFISMPAYATSLMRGGIPAFVEYLAITAIPIVLITVYSQRKLDPTV